jgi:hypothetical protein
MYRLVRHAKETSAKSKSMDIYHQRKVEATPWDKMCIDLIGPCTIRREENNDLTCKCVTIIDPATGWFEIHQYDVKITKDQLL